MKIMFKLLFLTVVLAMSGSVFAQEVISGKLTDAETGEPIEGVRIRFEGSKMEVLTDSEGRFKTQKEGTTQILIFAHADYEEISVNITEYPGGEIIKEMTSNLRFNQYGQRVSRQELSAESREGFLNFESKDKNYKLWFDNRLYLDGATYFDNYDHDLTQEENLAKGQLDMPGQYLKLRRMRFAIKARVGDNWYGEIDFDFDGNMVDIKDVYMRRFFGTPGSPWGQIKIGQFRMPQGMQQTTTSRYLKLIERAGVYKFNPNRRLGIGWASWNQHYSFGLAVHTEEARPDLDFEADPTLDYYSGPKDGAGVMQGAKPMLGVSTRGVYYPINETGKLVSVGAGFSHRTVGLYKYASGGRIKYDVKDETRVSEMEWTVAKVDGATAATNLNIDAALSYGPWRMTGEYYYNMVSVKDIATTTNFNGFYVQTAYLLTGENHAWNFREGEFTQVRAESKKGALEVAARYSYLNLNDFDAGLLGGQKGQYTVGINYYASRNVKFMLNYSYVNHDQYANGSGDYSDYVLQAAPGEAPMKGFDYGFLAWRCELDF
ncbi:MAG: porin [Bacteroidota bacterium]